LFAHGFNVHFKQIKPRKDLDVVLDCAQGAGAVWVRRRTNRDARTVSDCRLAQNATGQGHAKALPTLTVLAVARGGVLETTFAEETETDLSVNRPCFAAVRRNWWSKGYETLVEAGYQPEVAYYEVLHELKLIVDLLHEGGIAKMHK